MTSNTAVWHYYPATTLGAILACLGVVLTAGLPGAAAGSSDVQPNGTVLAPYLREVQSFRASGECPQREPLTPLDAGSLDAVTTEFVDLAERGDPRASRTVVHAAILLHTCASSSSILGLQLRRQHLRCATRIAAATAALQSEEFRRRFALLSASISLGVGEIEGAIGILDKALGRWGSDGETLLAQGALWQTIAGLRDDERPTASKLAVVAPVVISTLPALDLHVQPAWEPPSRIFEKCGVLFQRALERDPRLDEARVRLGGAAIAIARYGAAAAALEPLVSHPPDDEPATLYYALLFYGRAMSGVGQHDAAVNALRRAFTPCGGCQTAALALSQALRDSGDRAGAKRTLLEFLSREPRFDPWWDYPSGQSWRIASIVRRLLEDSPR